MLCGFCRSLAFCLLAVLLVLASSLEAAEPAESADSPLAIAAARAGETPATSSVARLAAAVVNRSAAAPPLLATSRMPPATPQLIRQLDDSSYEVRQAAAEQLDRLSREAEFAPALADQFQRTLGDERTSFEVRARLTELMGHLPPARSSPPALSRAELDHLLALLDDDSFAVRSGAVERLKWLAGNSTMICPLVEAVKSRLAEPNLSESTRQQLNPLWTKIHGAWLLSDSAAWNLPPVAAKQVDHWIDAYEHSTAADQAARLREQEGATRELLDLMVRPDTAPAVLRAIQKRLDDPQLEAADAARLRDLYDWSRPAMVAEYWDNHANQAIQHLLVGVPSMPPGAQFPSHFDECSNTVAHCVSGNSLSPGYYPVGIAFLHPRQPGAFFQLVYLPTTQRRLAYEFQIEDQTDAGRLAELSRRTLDRILEKCEPLDDDQMSLLELLDVDAVSHFVGPYFHAVADGAHNDYMGSFGTPSRHNVVCLWLAAHGTHDCVAGLTEAIDAHRISEPDESAPYRLSSIAALAISSRDSWPGQDAWLAQRISCTDHLQLGDTADVGATAAAQLLVRHGQKLQDFGLQEVDSETLNRAFKLQVYRFDRPESRAEVFRWWSHQE